MSVKRQNERFLSSYIELDNDCSERFGIATGGVTEYINRLNSTRYAPGRDEVLPRLVRYRNIRNKFAHEPGALRHSEELVKADVRWIRSFTRDLHRRRDPLSVFLRRARRFARRRKARKIVFFSAIGIAVLLLVIVLILLLNK